MKQYINFLFASAVSIFGCTKHEQMADTFVRTEKQLETAPDSALHTLKNIPRKILGNRAIRAKYSLLYTIAANRTKTDENTDSMLQIAWEYYRNHPKETRNRFRTLYYQAQSKLQKGDKPGALRQFLEVEEYLHSIDEPRYLGLLYLRIGDIYCSELNFVRAYRYYREARGLFMRTEDGKHTAEALLGMTASALRMNDLARARRDCSMALELADDAHDESLAQKSLGYFATLYVVADTVRIPEDLLRRIEQSVLCDTTVSGMCTRARTQLLRNRPAEALRSIEMAARRILRAEDRPMLLYTAYRANMQAGNYREAARQIDRFICPSAFLEKKLLTVPRFRGKTVMLHNFLSRVAAAAPAEKGDYVLYFGRLSEEKGIDRILEACKLLPDIPFVIAGSGPMEDLCKNCTLPNVKYVGFQTGKALEDLVAGALFTLHLSIWYENCPLALLESQSLGTPVLCNRIGGIPELVEEGRTGILNDTFTPAAYAEKIRALYADKPLLAEMSAHCIQKKDRMMTLERYCDQLLALYGDVLKNA